MTQEEALFVRRKKKMYLHSTCLTPQEGLILLLKHLFIRVVDGSSGERNIFLLRGPSSNRLVRFNLSLRNKEKSFILQGAMAHH
jgi:hypothetical protein